MDKPVQEPKVIILHGFEYADIDRIMRAVKPLFEAPRDLIFAKTTEHSLKMPVRALIDDLRGDHEYLQQNPPDFAKRTENG